MSRFTEADVEEATLAWLGELGYHTASGPEIGPDGNKPERSSYADVLLEGRLRQAIRRLNPWLPTEGLEEVLRKLSSSEIPNLTEENRRLHRLFGGRGPHRTTPARRLPWRRNGSPN